MRFVAGKSLLKDFKALGSGPIEVIRSRYKKPSICSMRLEVLSRRLMSPMVLFEAIWLESLASQSGLAKAVEGFGRFCSP